MARKLPNKGASERAIRNLVHDWTKETGFIVESGEMPLYSRFKSWAEIKGFGHYFVFRSDSGADFSAESWFDQELKQTWRN
jgi:hypothetical protein